MTEYTKCNCGGKILPSAMAKCSPYYCGDCGTVYSNTYMEKVKT